MLSIHSALLASNTIPRPVSEHPHASTPEGIWRKLESLYDLKALDEREDAIFADVVDDDVEDGDVETEEYWREFELPADGFEAEMWGRRLAGEEEEWSGDETGEREHRRESTVIEDSEDSRSSPVDAGSVRGTRSSGRRVAAGRRLVEVKQEGSVRGGSRRTSKAASPSVAEEDTEMQDADAQDENDEDSDEEDADSDGGDTTEDDRKGTKASRGRGGRRGARGRRGRRGK